VPGIGYSGVRAEVGAGAKTKTPSGVGLASFGARLHFASGFGMIAADWQKPAPSEGGNVPKSAPDSVAIDILLDPDARMLARAEANNARLLRAFPGGFALDAAHRPHITLLQCFVSAAHLEQIYAVVGALVAATDVTALTLHAIKYYYTPGPGVGLAGICAKPIPEILKLQADVIAAAGPFMLETATIAACTAPHDDPAMDSALIDYISNFVAQHAGDHFSPHVSTGVAPIAYLDSMLAEPFEVFPFSPAGAAVYQLGPFGTAARLLRQFQLRH
jgi:hypothetical protein